MSDFIIENGVLEKYTGTDAVVVIPAGVEKIHEDAFKKCGQIESITIPPTVKTIGYSAFKPCKKLTEVHISDVGAWCSIDLKSGLYTNPLYYAKNLYLNGTLLEDLIIPEGVTTIKRSAFYGCRSIVSVTLPQSVTVIEERAFDNCYSVTRVNVSHISHWLNIEIGGWRTSPLHGEACLYVNGEPMQHIDIPEGTTRIPAYAFAGYKMLTGVTIPNSVTHIGKGAFMYCRALSEIRIPDSVIEMGNSVFEGCEALREASLPDSITEIGDFTFSNCTSLTHFTLHSSVVSIGVGAFKGCSALADIKLPVSLRRIEENAFEKCVLLKEIVIPEGIEEIGKEAFSYCTKLERIYLPASLGIIGAYAFRECTSIRGVYIKDMASWCTTKFGNIDSNPFYYAHDLYLNGEKCTSVEIPDSVDNISAYCFYYCSCLESISIPSSVKSIGGYAFFQCDSLKRVYVDDLESWRHIDFENNYSNPLFYDAQLYSGGNPVSAEELNAMAAENIAYYLDNWKLELIIDEDRYNFRVQYTVDTIRFEEKDVVIKNGLVVGFNFCGMFIRLDDAGEEIVAPKAVAEMMGKPGRCYGYRALMKLTKE